MLAETPPSMAVAACFRSPYLALVLIANHEVSAFRRHCLDNRARTPEHLAQRIADFSTDYGANLIIVEPGASLTVPLRALGFTSTAIAIVDAKRAFLARQSESTHGDLYRSVIEQHPKLRRLVTVLNTGNVAEWERWRTILLLAVALGLAADRSTIVQPESQRQP